MLNALLLTVDRLAASLRRCVSVDDGNFSLLASSPPYDDLDEARQYAAVYRRPTDEQRAMLQGRRLLSAETSTVLEAVPELGFSVDRLCIPLRSGLSVVGYLWVGLARPLDPGEHELAVDAARTIVRVLDNYGQSVDAVNADIEAGLLGLLGLEEEVRAEAATSLRDLGMYVRSRSFVAVCVEVSTDWSPWASQSPRLLLTRALKRAITTPALDSYMFAATVPSTFLLIGYNSRPPRSIVDATVHAILTQLRRDESNLGEMTTIGIGDDVEHLEHAWQAFEQAQLVARTAKRLGVDVLRWGEHPLATDLETFTPSQPPAHLLSRALDAASHSDPALLETVKVFLDLAGDVSATATELRINRGTVYYRLSKFRQNTGIDLTRGDARFVTQAWLYSRATPTMSLGRPG